MNDACLDKLCNIAFAVSTIGLGALGIKPAAGVLDTAAGAVGLAAAMQRSRRGDFKGVLKNAKREIERDYRQWIEREHRDQAWYAEANLNNAIFEFERVIDHCVPDPADIVGVNLNGDKLADLLLARAATHSAAYAKDGDNPMARAVFRSIVAGSYALIRDNPDYAGMLRSYIDEKVLAGIDKLDAGQEQVDRKLDEILSAVNAEKGVPLAILRDILVKLGESDVALDPDAIEKRLREIADRHNELAARLRSLSNDDPGVVKLRKEAAESLEAGDYDRADDFLSEAEARDERAIEEQQDSLDRRKLSAAQTLAERGELERARLNYLKAAEHFAAAAARVPDTEEEARWRHLMAQALVLLNHGWEFGENPSLARAIATYRTALNLRPRERAPLHWAGTQNNLGTALLRLGERDSGTVHLEQAAAAFRAVLEVHTRARAPLDWAATQNNLGNTLQRLGERKSGTMHLEQAAAAFRAVLEVHTRARVPLGWAMTQNNLGNALKNLGQRQSSTARLKEAIDAYRAALEEWTRERVPLDWAATQNNLGAALQILGERENCTARLEEAVAAFRAALEERTRDRVPLGWAMTQNNLGNALLSLGERESGTARLEQAVDAYRAALEEQIRARVPLGWAMTQNNLGNALRRLGQRESGTARLKEAVAALRAALEERTRARVPLDWAITQNNLGNALKNLGERESGTAHLEEAVDVFLAALEAFENAGADFYISGTKQNLERAEALLRERRGG